MRAPTHEVLNQPPLLAGYDAFSADTLLRDAVARGGAAWVAPRAAELGALVGQESMQALASDANRFPPQLKTHDRFGHRLDVVEYHPAYHQLMAAGCERGVHSLAWTANRSGAFAARAALFYLWNQLEQGTACPMTMTFAGVQVLRHAPDLAREWEPKVLAAAYDPRPLPVADKGGATLGMAMTEKQGGSDLRAVQTRAQVLADGSYLLSGHKWFCSAPMSDAFFTLALLADGVTCFFVPRSLPDGTRNRFFIQRLKDKVGNRSNASSEVEYDDTLAWRIGEPGRGIPTLIEMAHLTRFDIAVGTAGIMRAGLHQAIHHARHRQAFGKRLAEHALMLNVLADLAVESETSTLMAFRLAQAFDRAPVDEHERHITRILTPIAKYWHCKRLTPFMVEAMECLGGNGYVEEGPLGRLYREAPLNGIWEGSGNVICLDVLRSMQKAPLVVSALLGEIAEATADDGRVTAFVAAIRDGLATSPTLEADARLVVERLALATQAALLRRHSPAEVADAFIASRIARAGGLAFGTLPSGTDCRRILERHFLSM